MLTSPTFSISFTDRANEIPISFIRDILKAANQPHTISFAGGLPNPALFPIEEIKKATVAVLETQGHAALQYATTEGNYSLRHFIAERYRIRYGLDIPPENIIITNGSQQALDLLGKAFLNPKDGVLVERPTYLGAIQSLSIFQPTFVEVPLHEDGIDTEELMEAFWNHTIKMMYCAPNFQNPTGYFYSDEKRRKIASMLSNYNAVLVEDDAYGEIFFHEEKACPIKCYNKEQVILMGSFSKIISPGLRIGWLVAEEAIIEKVLRIKQAADLHTSTFTQAIVAYYLQHCDFDEHCLRTRNWYQRKSKSMLELIKAYLPGWVELQEPKGGMFLWMKLPQEIDADIILHECMLHNVLFVPGRHFFVSHEQKNTIRLNFSNTSLEDMEKGIAILGRVLHQYE